MASKDQGDSTALDDEIRPYQERLLNLPGFLFPEEQATKVLDFLYLGGESNATDIDELRKLGITHIVNTASGCIRLDEDFYEPCRVGDRKMKLLKFPGEDDKSYEIMQHFQDTYDFIEEARKSGGKVLLHCMMGVNRSGTLATAYVMVHKNIGPITAYMQVKKARLCLMRNECFQRQMLEFAKARGLLHLDKEEVKSLM